MPKNCTRVSCASEYNFSRNGAFCEHVAQRSMFPYTLLVMTLWLANLMNLPGKMDRALAEEDSP